ncbi:MAG TPA: phosphoribosylformylglycinamidine cyclo-ligase [Candidatus Kapabacteria bacterium]|nr:phosphoribosylformylglycinamidine cyclo-ligase [Candidatus Kapabacteria bacterium]HOQ48469.1 phosphoribosylformylglycinamidine cyclo-ligase [Candidatus Kapabacteria bacterium]HPP40214.1 phosphoribosylformylglycinamidine cyclo-ligase [Candidatus Kapabacteria bacterium]HPU24302.1 phosphoribosylformylglycinamidine cyclo-ligase [Candidatus Kapabacteria bacterium]
MNETYKASGVNIEAGEKLVSRIKPLVKTTFNEKVLSEIGLFGGLYEAKFEGYAEPVLVASTDGVGTKLKVAFAANKHDTVGQCLVNHCVNDILACGAKPLFFLDYFATGRLEPTVAEQVISGFVKACRENSTALIGGETAEMPSIYADGEYDVSGTIVGVVDKSKILNGSAVKSGDVLIGLPSNGLHTNGYSLARKVLFAKYKVDDYIEDLGCSLGEELLKVHRSYLHLVHPMAEKGLLSGISHITGGGIVGNTSRVVRKPLELEIFWESWRRPPIFELIQKTGNVSEDEMRQVFNLGIGMVLITTEQNAYSIMETLKNENPVFIGRIK